MSPWKKEFFGELGKEPKGELHRKETHISVGGPVKAEIDPMNYFLRRPKASSKAREKKKTPWVGSVHPPRSKGHRYKKRRKGSKARKRSREGKGNQGDKTSGHEQRFFLKGIALYR